MSFQSFIYLIIIQIGYFYKKMMIDFYGDQDQTDTVKFGIYDCRESNNFLSQ